MTNETMKIILLMGQRIGTYEGQYAPEVITALTEYELLDNGDYLPRIKNESLSSGDYSHVEEISISVLRKEIEQILFNIPTINGKVG